MTKLILSLYRWFSGHKAVMYSILVGTTAVFGFFATKIHLEENIAALLPQTGKDEECAVAFSNIKLKDKVFMEIHSVTGSVPADSLAAIMDTYIGILQANDKEGLIGNCLYKFDTDDLMNAIYYGISALPCHLGEDFYDALDSSLNEEAIDEYCSGTIPEGLPDTSEMPYSFVNWHLFSKDSTTALAYLTPAFNTLDTKAGAKFEHLLTDSIEELQSTTGEDIEVLYHGAASEGTFNAHQIKMDLFLSIGISLVLICLLICICFKSWRALIHIVIPVIYGTVFSMACIYWIKGGMSLIAIGIGAIVLGVAVSYCLHLLTHLKFCEDVYTALREETRPICLGCLTTIGAFAGLMLTSSELLSDFGLFASFALIGTTLFVLIFLPHFLTKKDCTKNEKAFEVINKINSYPIDRNRFAVGALVVVCIVSILWSGKVKFDNDLNNIGYREPKVVKSESLYNEKVNGGWHSMSYASHAQDLDSAVIYMRNLYSVLDSLKAEGLVHSYSSMEGILVPLAEQQANIDRWKAFWTPEKTDRAYKLLKNAAVNHDWDTGEFDVPETFKLMAEADYEPQLISDAGVIPEALMCNYVEQGKDGWLVFTNVLMDRKNLKQVNKTVGDVQNIVVLDPFFYTGDMVEIVHNDFNIVLLISSIFVFAVLLLSYRCLTVSIIAFLPMMLSWYIVQGIMAILGIEFNLINIMISSFIFGIGVDYSIFVMDGLLNRAKFQSYRLLLCHKVAIFFSAVTLLAVTASLLFATHPAIHSIGASTIIGMTSTILITYALQPVLFKLAMKSPFLRRVALHEKKGN